jgi:chromosome segregation ATPase
MIKKILLVSLGVVLVGGLIFGAELFSYVGTAYKRVKSAAKSNVPIDFEIGRAREKIKELDPEIHKTMHAIAKEEASVEQLEKELERRQAALDKSKQAILRFRDDLSTGKTEFTYASRKYTAEQVKTDLAARFANHKTRESTVESLQKVLAARKGGLDAARQKLVEMQSAKRQMEVDVENLEARLKMVEVAQVSGSFEFDDSRISRARELVADLNARLDVMDKLARADRTGGEIPLDEPVADDVLDQVAKHFGESSISVAEVAERK